MLHTVQCTVSSMLRGSANSTNTDQYISSSPAVDGAFRLDGFVANVRDGTALIHPPRGSNEVGAATPRGRFGYSKRRKYGARKRWASKVRLSRALHCTSRHCAGPLRLVSQRCSLQAFSPGC